MPDAYQSQIVESLLPEGWSKALVGDYLYLKNGHAFKSSLYVSPSKSTFPIIRISDLDGRKTSDIKAVHVKEGVEGFELKKGDLLIAMSGATTGKVGIYDGNVPAYQNQRVGNLKLHSERNGCAAYRNYLISAISNQILKIAYGGAQPNISGKAIEELPIILPPLAEQKAIADKLDTLLAQVETTQARLERIPQTLKRFRQSVLAAAVSGKLTEEWRAEAQLSSIYDLIELWESEREELKSKKKLKKSCGPKSTPPAILEDTPESWAWVNFDHIAEHHNNALKAGPFGSALKKSDCIDSGFKVYGQEQVIAGNEQLATYYVSSDKYDQLNACAVNSGDILISLVGTIGKILVLSKEAEPGIINPRLVKLSLQEKINKSFIQIYLESPVAHDFFRGFSHGGTMEILNLSILKKLPVPLPAVEEQTEIVRRVEQLFAHADRIEQQVNHALARVNNLTQSILAKAFRGELTEQWRKNNPELISGENSAEALLERIQAERAAVAGKKKPRKVVKKVADGD